ncbi:YihY/virulence factor BrkB family protein [Sporosarcina beigongshangi]|uniref:YihY/virulence factor BrkB family protein n=1 Tax=Sporosarcina beigongshangi TaxID=2782538 RepID=UPI00193A16F0|nr:YihY/virulence factor BrkB family protein [Sporosarcina beigongshangi]
MKDKKRLTPEADNEKKVGKVRRKIDSIMGDTGLMKFYDDVVEGDLDKFDVTTTEGFWKELLIRIKKIDVTGLASQMAFFFLLSMFPLLIFLITLLPFLNIDAAQIFLYIREYAPSSVAMLIENTLAEVLTNRNGGLLSVGALATIWSASKGMNTLTRALNLSYETAETRSFILTRAMSFVFTVLLIVTLLIALVLPVFGQQIGIIAFSVWGLEEGFLAIWKSLRWSIPPILILIVFVTIYWLVPNVKLRWKSVLPGALFATLGWICTSLLFTFYVENFDSYSNTYGSIGAIIVLMIWLYFSGIILMLGGQLNAVMLERETIKALKKDNATT